MSYEDEVAADYFEDALNGISIHTDENDRLREAEERTQEYLRSQRQALRDLFVRAALAPSPIYAATADFLYPGTTSLEIDGGYAKTTDTIRTLGLEPIPLRDGGYAAIPGFSGNDRERVARRLQHYIEEHQGRFTLADLDELGAAVGLHPDEAVARVLDTLHSLTPGNSAALLAHLDQRIEPQTMAEHIEGLHQQRRDRHRPARNEHLQREPAGVQR